MKKYFTLLAFLSLVTLVSCDKDEPGETPQKEYDIYFACINVEKVEGETDVRPAYWKNGQRVILQTEGLKYGVSDIFVTNGDVYISGLETSTDFDLKRAVYWRNGKLIKLSEGNSISSEATSMCVVGNDVYVAGICIEKTEDDRKQKHTAYWKNGELVYLPDGASEAISICVSGSDVYVLDKKGYWKNGIRTRLPLLSDDSHSYATDMQVVGNDVYISSSESSSVSKLVARYWKNGIPITLSEDNSFTTSIFVSGNNIYVAGMDNIVDKKVEIVGCVTYWKNGVPVYLSDNSEFSYATSISVLDNNVFVGGHMGEERGYWVNGTFHVVDIYVDVETLFVVERK